MLILKGVLKSHLIALFRNFLSFVAVFMSAARKEKYVPLLFKRYDHGELENEMDYQTAFYFQLTN